MVNALVFDMDGLLFDSERIVQRSWEDSGKMLGLSGMGSHIYHTLGMNARARRAYFDGAAGTDFPYDEFTAHSRVRFREIVEEEGLPVKQGVRELLTYAREHGLKTAIATSSAGEHAVRNLREAGLEAYFDGFISGDMVRHAKPDPEIYLRACETINTAPGQCMALEDSPNGVRSANAAGLIPVMVPDLAVPDEEMEKLTYKVVDSLHDVAALIDELNRDRMP